MFFIGFHLGGKLRLVVDEACGEGSCHVAGEELITSEFQGRETRFKEEDLNPGDAWNIEDTSCGLMLRALKLPKLLQEGLVSAPLRFGASVGKCEHGIVE